MKKKRLPQLYQLFNDKWLDYYYDNIFIISDTHFDEEDMNKYYNRPSSEEIVSRINSVVHKNDTLIIGPKLILSHEPVNVPFALNIHGHTHSKEYKNDDFHYCVCAEKLDYKPINLKHLIQTGVLKNIKTIHEQCIKERNN